MLYQHYLQKAKDVLKLNWTGRYTVPSIHLYPHQWNWDSAFIAIGYSRYDLDKALTEIKSLFEGQWKNGMLPHIVFNKKNLGKYFPEPDFWQTYKSKNAPDIPTSGITQPPIHSWAILKIYKNAKDKEKVKEFIKWIYPKLIKLHRFFYLERNPYDNGLIYIIHPWESGMDNSPMWDIVLDRIDLNKVKVPSFKRKDDKIIDPSQRPKDIDYKRYIYLVDLFRRLNYDEKKIFKESPFLVADVLFNSILNASNEALIELAQIIGEDYKTPEKWCEQTSRAVRDALFDSRKKIFFPYDFIENKLIKVETAAGFMPLFGNIASEYQAKLIYQYLNSKNFCQLHQGNCFAVPNYDTTKKDFSSKNYWRGPVWININYLLYHGLKNYGFEEKAYHLEKTIIELPIRFDFYEYFDSKTGVGYGTRDFSWTASLFIDMLYTYKNRKNKNKAKNSISKPVVLNESDSITPKSTVTSNILERFNKFYKALTDKYIEKGIVKYNQIRISPEYKILKQVVKNLKYINLHEILTENAKKSFWINIYNFMVIDFIISLKIKESVMEMDGFFENLKYSIGGLQLSLDDILHGILRKNSINPFTGKKQFEKDFLFFLQQKDERVIFAITQGARSSPVVWYYRKEDVDSQLDNKTQFFIQGSEVLVIPERKTVYLSKLFQWYSADFKNDSEKINFIKKYIKDNDKKVFLKHNQNINIEYFNFDWSLNY